jgi:hypothetical protein
LQIDGRELPDVEGFKDGQLRNFLQTVLVYAKGNQAAQAFEARNATMRILLAVKAQHLNGVGDTVERIRALRKRLPINFDVVFETAQFVHIN